MLLLAVHAATPEWQFLLGSLPALVQCVRFWQIIDGIPELESGLHGRVIKHLIAAGHRISGAFDDGAEIRAAAVGKPYLERVHAHMDSSESAASAFRFGMGQLSQHGIGLHDFVGDNAAITLHKLDQVMSSKNIESGNEWVSKLLLLDAV